MVTKNFDQDEDGQEQIQSFQRFLIPVKRPDSEKQSSAQEPPSGSSRLAGLLEFDALADHPHGSSRREVSID